VTGHLGRQAGAAMRWKSIQVVSIKVIFLGRTLILARLLAPEDFGLVAISLIAVDFLMSITNFGMVPALVQHTAPEERHYNAAWTIGMIRAAAISLLVFWAAPWIAHLFAEPRATALIRVMALLPVLEAAVSIKAAELTRNLRFRSLALIHVPEALANAVVAVALAPFLGVWALVAGTMVGPLVRAVVSYLLAPHRPRLLLDAAAVRPLIHFGRWIFLTSLVAVAGGSLVQLAISRQLGAAELGLYYLAAKLAFIPAEIAADTIGGVAFPLYSRLQGDVQQVARAFRAILVGAAALLLPLCALLIALAPSLVANILGPRWVGAVDVIRLLALVNVVGLLGDTVVPILKGMGKPGGLVLLEIIQSSLLILLIWSFTGAFGIAGAGLAWLAAIGASQLLSGFLLQRLLPSPFSDLGRPLVVIAAIAVLGGGVALIMDSAAHGIGGFLLAGSISMALMGWLLWLSDRRWQLGLFASAGLVLPRLAARFKPAAVDHHRAESHG
jgi:lipopolysaccharide exporter